MNQGLRLPQSTDVSLFEGILCSAFDQLPKCVRALHRCRGTRIYRGEVEIDRGRNLLSRFCGWATALPPPGRAPIEVEIVAEGDHERWTRHVGRHAMRSRLWADEKILCERLGLMEFGFRLSVENEALVWRVVRVRALGLLPLPASWFGGVNARESGVDDRYCFDVRAEMPVVGLLVHYRGWLDTGEAIEASSVASTA